MFAEAAALGAMSVCAILITAGSVFGMRFLCKYHVVVDVLTTIGVGALMASTGTAIGMFTGVFAGLFMAVILIVLNFVFMTVDAIKEVNETGRKRSGEK